MSKFSKIREFFAAYPTPTASLSLGLAGLSSLLTSRYTALNIIPLIIGFISFLLIVVLFIKYSICRKQLIKDMSDYVLGAVLPTMSMSLMILSKILTPYMYYTAYAIWLFAIFWHIFVVSGFLYFRLKEFRVDEILPSWFVPPVGIAMAAVTMHPMGNYDLVKALLMFAMTAYFIILPLMQYRLLLGKAILPQNRPTIAILAAPPNLCLSGYLSLVQEPQAWLVFLFLGLALFMTFSIYLCLFTILKAPFSPAFSALTFPAIIGATALMLVSRYLQAEGYSSGWVDVVLWIAASEFVFSTSMVMYVTYGYYVYYFQNNRKNSYIIRMDEHR